MRVCTYQCTCVCNHVCVCAHVRVRVTRQLGSLRPEQLLQNSLSTHRSHFPITSWTSRLWREAEIQPHGGEGAAHTPSPVAAARDLPATSPAERALQLPELRVLPAPCGLPS